eukprot:scaffold142446_cov32-Tisochrysis_lutea.AAC.4
MIYLHVGQAGNEIGSAFWRYALGEGPPRRWLFDEVGRCRAVFVDTEPKVRSGHTHSARMGNLLIKTVGTRPAMPLPNGCHLCPACDESAAGARRS